MRQSYKKIGILLMVCLLVGSISACKKKAEPEAKSEILVSVSKDVDFSKLPEKEEEASENGEDADQEEEIPSPDATQQGNTSKPSSGSNTSQGGSSTPSSGDNNSQGNTSTPTQTPSTPSSSYSSEKQQVLNLVNQERANAGLPALTYRYDLQGAADTRAQEIITKFDHTRPNGESCYSVVNVSYRALGENIAWGQPTPAVVMSRWMGSDGHRKNILNSNFTGIAVGVAESNGTMYWVQIFIG